MMTQDVATTTTVDRRQIVDLLTRAFADDPPVTWAFPDAQRFSAHFGRFVEAFAGAAFDMGTAHCIGGQVGAALWLPPGAHSDDEALAALFEEATPADRRDDLYALFEQMGQFHPTEPHWHLALIGVDPAMQGRGLGSRLLEATLAVCDGAGQPAYLEATTPRNVALYERYGFERTGTIQAGTSPLVVPMVRPPRR